MEIKIEGKEYFNELKWADEHYSELQKKYKDKWVAVVGKKIVSFGVDLGKVKKEASEKTGKREIPVIFVECGSHIY